MARRKATGYVMVGFEFEFDEEFEGEFAEDEVFEWAMEHAEFTETRDGGIKLVNNVDCGYVYVLDAPSIEDITEI